MKSSSSQKSHEMQRKIGAPNICSQTEFLVCKLLLQKRHYQNNSVKMAFSKNKQSKLFSQTRHYQYCSLRKVIKKTLWKLLPQKRRQNCSLIKYINKLLTQKGPQVCYLKKDNMKIAPSKKTLPKLLHQKSHCQSCSFKKYFFIIWFT